MRTFTGEKSIATITRQSYTGGISTYNLTPYSNISFYMRPLTEEQSTMNGYQFGTGFSGIFETNIDVREGDKINTATATYMVRGVVKHDRGFNTAYTRCLLLKAENA